MNTIYRLTFSDNFVSDYSISKESFFKEIPLTYVINLGFSISSELAGGIRKFTKKEYSATIEPIELI